MTERFGVALAPEPTLVGVKRRSRPPHAGREIPDDLYEELTRHFSEREIVAPTIAIVSINGWNRLNVGPGARGRSGSRDVRSLQARPWF